MGNGGRRTRSSGGGWGSVLGVLLIVGLIIKFIWWIVGALALVAIFYFARAVVRQRNIDESAHDRRMAEIAARADQQHTWAMQGDARGIYGPAGAKLMRFVEGTAVDLRQSQKCSSPRGPVTQPPGPP